MNYQEAIDKAMKLLRLSKSPVPAEAESKRNEAGSGLALVKVNQAIAKIEQRKSDVDAYIAANMSLGKARSTSFKTFTGGRQDGQREGRNLRMTGAKAGLSCGRRELA